MVRNIDVGWALADLQQRLATVEATLSRVSTCVPKAIVRANSTKEAYPSAPDGNVLATNALHKNVLQLAFNASNTSLYFFSADVRLRNVPQAPLFNVSGLLTCDVLSTTNDLLSNTKLAWPGSFQLQLAAHGHLMSWHTDAFNVLAFPKGPVRIHVQCSSTADNTWDYAFNMRLIESTCARSGD